MSYQIPQQLAYKEKIMFGLTFKQLIYAFLFGFIGIILFKKIDGTTPKIIFTTLPMLIGLGFMFFDLDTKIKNYHIYLKFKEINSKELKFRNFFGVKEIKDDFIINNKNRKIAILKVSTINFSMKPTQEKDAIIKSFQKFLNSLDFPTQILMSTENISLTDYLSSLKSKITSTKFSELFDNYQEHLSNIISSNKIMNRNFYIVIPETNEIDIQVGICTERLHSLRLKTNRLNSKQLQKLLTNFFKGKNKGDFFDSIFPDYIHSHQDHLEINGEYSRIIYASGYPRYVESGFLDKIISSLGDFDLSIHVKPYEIEGMLIGLNRELQKQRADLYSMQLKGIVNTSLEIQYKDTRNTLEDLQKGKDRLFNVSLYVNCKANSLEELNLLTRKVESELNSLMILPKIPDFRMLQGFKSVAPLGVDELNQNRNITTEALSAFFPFTSQFLEVDRDGIWMGLNKNKIPIIRDIFKLPNPNGLVLAQSGGGKSYFCKLLITRYLLNGTKVMVIDPQGEYRNIINHFEGERIDLSKDSPNIINPLDLMGHDYIEKRLSLIDLMKIMLGDLTDIQRAFLDKAITMTYEHKGITKNPDSWGNTPPILGDLLNSLRKMEKRATRLEQTTLNSLANRLDMYVNGVFGFFNQQTNIDFDNKFVCFDIGDMPAQVKPPIMFLVLDYIYMKMKSDLSRKILLIDESWSLLSRTEDAGYIFEIVKTCRKFNLGLLLINQEVEGLLESKAGKSVLANSSYTMLMRQKPAVIDNICRTFHLSDNERTHILTANIGEGLLIMEDDHTEIKVIASPEEHKLITTNADELVKENNYFNSPNKKRKDVKIKIDENKRFFRKKELSKDEVKFLLSKGYKISKQKSLLKNKEEDFLLLPRHNESITHLFCTYDISEYLESKGVEVKQYVTRKPDIVFNIGKNKYAIEVETGAGLKVPSRMKEKLNGLSKYDEWFFVLTNRKKIQEYRKFGKSIDLRYLQNKLDRLLKIRNEK
jgi:type IV secretory pathway VirB4 component